MKILIYRIGSLGDNLVALPAIIAIKNKFPTSKLYLLSDIQSNSLISGKDVFEGSGLFEGYIQYPSGVGLFRKILQLFVFLGLLIRLKNFHFYILGYLAPSDRTKSQIKRDLLFFKWANIKNVIGADGPFTFEIQNSLDPLLKYRSEADYLLERLKRSGIKTPTTGKAKYELALNTSDIKQFNESLPSFSNSKKQWIGIGPGSNMPAKIWPLERYKEVLKKMIKKFVLWPVVFGGEADKEIGEKLIKYLGMGYNLAGRLTIRQSAVGLKKCRFYLGNDTGTMHLAAAVGTPCVAIFSSRDKPGKWYPYGNNHTILRTSISCEGCMLVKCVKRRMECLTTIHSDLVLNACVKMMKKKR